MRLSSTRRLAFLSALMLTGCALFPPSIEKARETLVDAGYTVTVTDGLEVDNDNEGSFLFGIFGIDELVYGKKNADEIYLIYFLSMETAESQGSFIQAPTGMKMGRINEMVYVGTSQGIKDAKL